MPSSTPSRHAMAFSRPILRSFFLVPLALLAVGSMAIAQEPPPPAAATPDANSTNFQNAPANNILDLYESLSGKHLIRDINLANVTVSLNATGMDKADMLKYIEEVLLLNNVALVPVDDQTMKVV